jgi:ribosomal protein S18 acetylase RimI-like enzyme
MNLRELDAITVNLDPGAENLPYEPDVDIRDWISLEEVIGYVCVNLIFEECHILNLAVRPDF